MSGYGRRREDGVGVASTYHRSRIMSSTPEELVVLLYEQLLADLRGADVAIQAGNLHAKSERIQRANDVLFELLAALDPEQGGEVSERLAALYSYMIQQLGSVSRTLDPTALQELSGLVESLLGAWRSVADAAAPDQLLQAQ